MSIFDFYKKLTALLLICFANFLFSQGPHSISISTSNDKCEKGAAGFQVNGSSTADTISSYWSTNVYNANSINNLNAGDYFVHVIIKHTLDTTIYFTIQKEECVVVVSNQFTPNGDNYNDYLQISNVIDYPNFELFIFNKWGQQVHSQKKTYTPWDGTWNGLKVPDETYYYVFYYDANHKNKFIKGDITIIR